MTGEKRVVVIGAGIGGIISGIALKNRLSFDNFTIYEKRSDLGGTWLRNTFPGCASDVGVHWYSLSTELEPYWPSTHGSQPEIRDYWDRLASKHSLRNHMVFNTSVDSIEWDNERQFYRIFLRNTTTGYAREDYAHAIISAVGGLDTPAIPESMKSIETFSGVYFHAANWDHTVSLKGKRVAVIGNASTANQFLPLIAEDSSTQIVNFARTPNWVVPNMKVPIPKWTQWIFAHFPLLMRIHRIILVALYEMVYLLILQKRSAYIRRWLEKGLILYMKSSAPERYHEMLIPKYAAGCKRLVMDTGYFKALHLPTVQLNMDGIRNFNETGLVTEKGQFMLFDIIIFATGFTPHRCSVRMVGKDGNTYQQYEEEQDRPVAYYGVAVPNFPNLFLLLGPNSTTGHGSVIFHEEVQVNYALQFIKPILEGAVCSFEVKDAATQAFLAEMEERLFDSVWTRCESWYRVGQRGVVSVLWPGTVTEYWWRLRDVNWNHYTVVGGEKWLRRRKINAIVKIVAMMGAVGVAFYIQRKWVASCRS